MQHWPLVISKKLHGFIVGHALNGGAIDSHDLVTYKRVRSRLIELCYLITCKNGPLARGRFFRCFVVVVVVVVVV